MTAATDPGRVAWLNPETGLIVSDSMKQSFPYQTHVYTIPLVRESLLAEAESRIIALQAQVDAVRALTDVLDKEMQDFGLDGSTTATEIRAALGEK